MKVAELTFEQVDEVISYDPEEGTFTWKVSVGKNIKAGVSCGAWKGIRSKTTGAVKKYLYIVYLGREMTASRVAWLLSYREWPSTVVQFIDGDNTNFKLSNLKLAEFPSERVSQDGRVKHRMSPEAQRHYGLMRNYKIGATEYAQMYMAQDGKCAICGNPETTIVHGKVRDMSVDHNHVTGANRELLCNACNHILGEAKENLYTLLNSVLYLVKHEESKTEELGKVMGFVRQAITCLPVGPNKHTSDDSSEALGIPALQTGLADAAQTSGPTLVQEEGKGNGLHDIHRPYSGG